MDFDPFFDLTHNYTDEPGPMNSPSLPVCLDFRGLAERHRTLSERGILTGRFAWSTPNCRFVSGIADSLVIGAKNTVNTASMAELAAGSRRAGRFAGP